ncbi:MAG: iron donor protein CyaY [Deltaproteobacteria bacterium]|nr:iron donor protein CyaY [Deltaproteobacteria bacterium]
MDEQAFRACVRGTLDRIRLALDALPTDALDLGSQEGVLALEFEDAEPWILSQQVPVQELWLAADRHAWHFVLDGDRWRERGSAETLEAILGGRLSARLGFPVDLEG